MHMFLITLPLILVSISSSKLCSRWICLRTGRALDSKYSSRCNLTLASISRSYENKEKSLNQTNDKRINYIVLKFLKIESMTSTISTGNSRKQALQLQLPRQNGHTFSNSSRVFPGYLINVNHSELPASIVDQ